MASQVGAAFPQPGDAEHPRRGPVLVFSDAAFARDLCQREQPLVLPHLPPGRGRRRRKGRGIGELVEPVERDQAAPLAFGIAESPPLRAVVVHRLFRRPDPAPPPLHHLRTAVACRGGAHDDGGVGDADARGFPQVRQPLGKAQRDLQLAEILPHQAEGGTTGGFVAHTQDYAKLYQEAYANNPETGKTIGQAITPALDPTSPAYLGNAPTIDRQSELINRNAVNEIYNLNISGGTTLSNYSIGAGYNRQESTLKFNYQERYSFNANSDFKIKKWLEVGETFRLAYANNNDNRYNTGDLNSVAFTPPWQSLYDPTNPTGFATYDVAKYGVEADGNFLAAAKYSNNKEGVLRTLGSGFATIIPLPGLRIKGSVSVDYAYNKRVQYGINDILTNFLFSTPSGNTYGERYSTTMNILKEFSVNYNKSFGDHNLDILLNASDQRVNWNIQDATVRGIPLQNPESFTITNGDNKTLTASSFKEPSALIGYIGRLSYKYKDKYYLDGVYSISSTSYFSPETRKGYFPSFSASWRISRESFMENLSFISDLKLRGGYGQLGNYLTAKPFAYLSTVNRNPAYTLGSTANGAGLPYTGAILGDFPNRALTWEKVTTSNIGLEGSVLNNSISFTIEYYSRYTEGILQQANLPLTTGLTSLKTFNIANVSNKGIELVLGYKGKVGDFQYNISGNITTVKNEVLSLYENQPQYTGNNTRIAVGESINSIIGYKTNGIFQNQQEVNDWLAAHAKSTDANGNQITSDNIVLLSPGDVRFVDIHSKPNGVGGPDGVVNGNDIAVLGKTIPGYYYGLNLGGNYKGVDLSILFQGVGDVQKINNFKQRSEGEIDAKGNNVLTSILDRWTPTHPSNSTPRVVYQNPSANTRMSDRYVENAGYLRLNNIQLGYNIPKPLLSKVQFIDSFRIYLQSTNTFVITKYKGIDPDNDYNPVPRGFLIGINASF